MMKMHHFNNLAFGLVDWLGIFLITQSSCNGLRYKDNKTGVMICKWTQWCLWLFMVYVFMLCLWKETGKINVAGKWTWHLTYIDNITAILPISDEFLQQSTFYFRSYIMGWGQKVFGRNVKLCLVNYLIAC